MSTFATAFKNHWHNHHTEQTNLFIEHDICARLIWYIAKTFSAFNIPGPSPITQSIAAAVFRIRPVKSE